MHLTFKSHLGTLTCKMRHRSTRFITCHDTREFVNFILVRGLRNLYSNDGRAYLFKQQREDNRGEYRKVNSMCTAICVVWRFHLGWGYDKADVYRAPFRKAARKSNTQIITFSMACPNVNRARFGMVLLFTGGYMMLPSHSAKRSVKQLIT